VELGRVRHAIDKVPQGTAPMAGSSNEAARRESGRAFASDPRLSRIPRGIIEVSENPQD